MFDHAVTYGVKQVVFVGRHTFYGAAADSPLYHTEEEPPLEVARFPELADLVAADLFAGSTLWRHPEIDTAVLRLRKALGDRKIIATVVKRGYRLAIDESFEPAFARSEHPSGT